MTAKTIQPAGDPQAILEALGTARRGLVVFPQIRSAVGRLVSERSIRQLYAVKGREASKAIPILISDPAELVAVAAEVTPWVARLAQRFWPGPLTLVVPRRPDLPEELSVHPTVGVRMPDHPDALRLLQQTGPLAVTSANLSGQPSASTAQEVLDYLGGLIPLILDGGRTPGGVSSTVVDCTTQEPVILRPGPVSIDELLSVWGSRLND
jgi:L-threonylcarbamoyladenylate synthase